FALQVKEASYKRLCEKKTILTVNGKFPGPTLEVHKGETIFVDVYNKGQHNITIHWHGVKQPRNPWTDGPEYITQCPIQPGNNFSQKVIFSKEEGTLWWHAHSDWSRATVHGAIIVYPAPGTPYPFPKPAAEVPIILELGEWWKEDIMKVLEDFVASGGQPADSDAYTINGQPGDLYPCSNRTTFKMKVKQGKTYLLRIVNADLNEILFFGIAKHNLTVVGTDGSYSKPLTHDYIVISPGQTMDCLLQANQAKDQSNQQPSHYYMASRVYAIAGTFDNTTTTAIIEYTGNYTVPSSPPLPTLPNTFPDYNDTLASANFTRRLKSLADQNNPIDVPLNVTTSLFFTLSINSRPCEKTNCSGPSGERLLASVNNITFDLPKIDILQAYYNQTTTGVYESDFPSNPPFVFNYTADSIPVALWRPESGTKVKVVEFNSTVEIVFQGTNTVTGIEHPMHLHGYSFYVVGSGFGNFNKTKDPLNYNLVDPPLQNTIAVPRNGWTTIRFKADNPGVWFMHCHFERHTSWGMEMAFIVKNGKSSDGQMRPPPPNMPKC
ncbi:laccase-14, partial [Phtheirospermum japonicum]